jgi:hypothetical protein
MTFQPPFQVLLSFAFAPFDRTIVGEMKRTLFASEIELHVPRPNRFEYLIGIDRPSPIFDIFVQGQIGRFDPVIDDVGDPALASHVTIRSHKMHGAKKDRHVKPSRILRPSKCRSFDVLRLCRRIRGSRFRSLGI